MSARKLRRHSIGLRLLCVTTKSAAAKRCETFTVSWPIGETASGRTGEAGVRHCTRSRRVHEARKRARPPAPSSFTPFPPKGPPHPPQRKKGGARPPHFPR